MRCPLLLQKVFPYLVLLYIPVGLMLIYGCLLIRIRVRAGTARPECICAARLRRPNTHPQTPPTAVELVPASELVVQGGEVRSPLHRDPPVQGTLRGTTQA